MLKIVYLPSLLFLLTQHAFAFWDDPFQTEKLLPPPIQNTSAAPDICSRTFSSEQALSLLDVLDFTLCNNPKMRSYWAAAQLSAAELGSTKSLLLPTFSASIEESNSKQKRQKNTQSQNAQFSLSWLIYDFGARKSQIERATHLFNASVLSENANVQALMLEATTAYFDAVAEYASVDAALESEKSSQESFNAAKDRYEVGIGTPADKLQAQTALSQATLKRIQAEGNLKIALAKLAHLMGFSTAHPKIVLDKAPPIPSQLQINQALKPLIDEALVLRPDLKAAFETAQAAQQFVEYQKAQNRPSIQLSARGNWNREKNTLSANNAFNPTHSGSIGVQVQIPIFTGFSQHYQIKAAKAQEEAAKSDYESLQNQVALEVWQAYQNLFTAVQSLKATEDLVNSAQQSADVAMGRYKSGVGNVLDLLSAQAALAEAKLQKIQAQSGWFKYCAELAKSVGRLNYQLLQNNLQPASLLSNQRNVK